MARPVGTDAATRRVLVELVRRLLVTARELHTESGRHAKLPTSWQTWTIERRMGALPSPDEARAHLEHLVGGQHRLLPWSSLASGRATR